MPILPKLYKENFTAHSRMIDSTFGPAPVEPKIGKISDELNIQLTLFITEKLQVFDQDVIATSPRAVARTNEALDD